MENYSRRYVMKASLFTFGSICMGLPGIIAACKEPKSASGGHLNWDQFVHNLEQRARDQHGSLWNQESYVNSVARLLGNLSLHDSKLQGAMPAYPGHRYGIPEFAELLRTNDVQISLITFEKNEWLPHHNHPSMTGVLTCANGNLLVTSYNPVPSAGVSGSSSLLLRRVGTESITPGSIATLTEKRQNVHTVKALSFTQVIDIFTPPYNAERTNKTAWYRVEPRPLRGQEDLFVAHPY